MKRIQHWFAHLFKWNYGHVETWWEPDIDGTLMVGFRCSGCGKLQGVEPIKRERRVLPQPMEGKCLK